jgi:MoxR-like ATPase
MMTLVRAARVVAWLAGRSHVLPDDVAGVFPATMGHRLFFTPLYEARRGQIADALVAQILQRVPTPR